ncbi:hypothetical protein LZ30DRAFT_71250 [Colletotrichum cereale]|nr:hypothetical protein LZ30DRAFT_71250 [Colletotrichum cereale]
MRSPADQGFTRLLLSYSVHASNYATDTDSLLSGRTTMHKRAGQQGARAKRGEALACVARLASEELGTQGEARTFLKYPLLFISLDKANNDTNFARLFSLLPGNLQNERRQSRQRRTFFLAIFSCRLLYARQQSKHRQRQRLRGSVALSRPHTSRTKH